MEAYIAMALSAIMVFVYASIGRIVGRRDVSEEAELARRSFQAWWYLLAAVSVGGIVSAVVSKFDGWSVAGLMTYTQVLLLVILAALAGLLYYFLYLLTGWRSMWRTITFAYAAYYVAILFFLQWADPVGIKQGAISDSLEYGREVTGHWFATVLGALLLAPVFIGALGYFSLYFKAPDRSGRFRIGALAGAFVFWFGTSLLASYVFHWNDHTWWRWASSLVSLIASYMVYISYRPPAWMRKRFRLHGYDDAEPA